MGKRFRPLHSIPFEDKRVGKSIGKRVRQLHLRTKGLAKGFVYTNSGFACISVKELWQNWGKSKYL
jgi:hypothetical protein